MQMVIEAECEAAKKLDHENIIKLISYGSNKILNAPNDGYLLKTAYL